MRLLEYFYLPRLYLPPESGKNNRNLKFECVDFKFGDHEDNVIFLELYEA